MKRPAFQFYPSDWRKDPALSACSLAARGLWIELVCIAHESDNYGHLSINGKAMSLPQLARMVGESPSSVSKLMRELADAGVYSQTDEGVIFSRRMVKDEHIRNVRAEAGRLGGNPDLLKQKDKQTGKQKPTPSSSSLSSPSGSSEPNGSGGAAAGKREKTPAEHRKSELWRSIKSLLVESGESKDLKAAGAVITQAITRYDEPTALAAIEATLHAKPAGAIAFLEAACQQASGHRPNKQEALEAGNLAAAERFAME